MISTTWGEQQKPGMEGQVDLFIAKLYNFLEN